MASVEGHQSYYRGTDLDWSDQVSVVATSPAHRQLVIAGYSGRLDSSDLARWTARR